MNHLLPSMIIVGLPAFAITYLMRYTSGPGDIFARVRRVVGLDLPVYLGSSDVITRYQENSSPDTFLAKLYGCYWCLTTWVCLLLSLWYIWLTQYLWWYGVFIWFGAVAVSGVLKEAIDG